MRSDSKVILGYLQIATGFGILLFWSLFFTVGLAPQDPVACYFAFEHAFPLPDSVLAAGLIVAGSLLVRGAPQGVPLSLVCAGGLIFLGLIDTSFELLNGAYSALSLDVSLSAAINLWCTGFGASIVLTLGAPEGQPRAISAGR